MFQRFENRERKPDVLKKGVNFFFIASRVSLSLCICQKYLSLANPEDDHSLVYLQVKTESPLSVAPPIVSRQHNTTMETQGSRTRRQTRRQRTKILICMRRSRSGMGGNANAAKRNKSIRCIFRAQNTRGNSYLGTSRTRVATDECVYLFPFLSLSSFSLLYDLHLCTPVVNFMRRLLH